MSGNRASACMCCGAPWSPIHDEVVDLDRLGNRSLLWMHRLFVTDPHMREKFTHPKLYDTEHASHMLHASHHRWAVQVMSRLRPGDANMLAIRDAAAPHHDIGRGFPFLRNPTSERNSTGLIASWDAPAPENRLVHRALMTAMSGGGYPVDEYQDDFELTLANCKACNAVMTQEFFFRYHLYTGDRVNPHRLIHGTPITLWRAARATVDMEDIPDWVMNAQVMQAGAAEEYPLARYDDRKDIMTAAVGYFLHTCLPTDGLYPPGFDAADFTDDFRALYLHMCWVVLEVVCLISEFTRGNRNLKKGKLLQAPKSHLGAIEQYLSYFGYRILCWHTPALERVGFPAWHQLFFWFAWRCDALFDANARRPPLWAYAIMPQGSETMRSRRMVRAVSRLMVDQLIPLGRIRDHILGLAIPPEVPLPGVARYFLTTPKMAAMLVQLRRGTQHDLDSYLEQVGVDCMFQRVLDLSYECEEGIRREMRSFIMRWHTYEVSNVRRHAFYQNQDLTTSRMIYTYHKLLYRGDGIPRSATVFAEMARGPRRCPWVAAYRLHELGAFNFNDAEKDRRLRGRRAAMVRPEP